MVRICCVCGSGKFSVALIDCDKCEEICIHKYCLGTLPDNMNEYVTWFCEDCEEEPIVAGPSSVIGPDSYVVEEESEDEDFCAMDVEDDFLYAPVPPGAEEDPLYVPVPPEPEEDPLYVPVPPEPKEDPLYVPVPPEPVRVPPEPEEDSLYVSKPPGTGEDYLYVPVPLEAEEDCSYVPELDLLKKDESLEAKEEENGILDLDEDINLISLLKKKRRYKRKLMTMQSKNGESRNEKDVLGGKGDRVAQVGSSDKSSVVCDKNGGKERESKKLKMTTREGEKNCIEENNATDNHEAEEVEENRMLVSVGGEQCNQGRGGDHVGTEQSKISNKVELNNIGSNDRATVGCVDMSQKGYIVRAQPIIDAVWKGQFDILNGKRYGAIGGLSAHLSSLACEKVHCESKLLPGHLSLDLLHRSEIWPKKFEDSRPNDNSIALYFFPNSERNESAYETLINDMLDNDLAMRAVLESAELLIFTSTRLPIESWRFRSKIYLWGVFRRKQATNTVKGELAAGENQHIAAVPLTMFSPISPVSPLQH